MSARAETPAARHVVERYLQEVLNGEGPAGVDDLIANPIFSQQIRAFCAAFPDLLVESRMVVADRDLVAVHATGQGTHRGLFQGLPSTGRRWRATLTAVYQVTDGQITDYWGTWDTLSIMEQLGGVRRTAEASA